MVDCGGAGEPAMGQTRAHTDWTPSGHGASSAPARPLPRGLMIALVTIWMVALFAAMAGLWKYKLTPGPRPSSPPHGDWPSGSQLSLQPDTPTLVMFAHPQCVCTRASLAELRQVTSRFGSRVHATVAFVRPAGTPKDWTHSDTWDLAGSIPGVTVLADDDGREAARFGSRTSGHVVLYSTTGRLLFAGGITPARGHVGDSPQMDRLVALLESEIRRPSPTDHSTKPSDTPGAVYGCPLTENMP